MDHNRYDWSLLVRRKPVEWPNGARIALWIVPALEFFPLDMPAKPFRAPGGMVLPYPDLRHFTLREYGNRVGIFRVMDALDASGISRVSVALNSAVAERTPYLVAEIKRRNWEVIAHGVDMGKLHYGGQAEGEEKALVAEAVGKLRALTGQKVRGWLSPAKSQSLNTPDLAAAEGIEYVCDWINDDMPYPFRTKNGTLTAMPHQHWISDSTILFNYKQTGDDFVDQITDQFDVLYDEAGRQGGRIMAITLHPWMTGQPHRIKYLEAALAAIAHRKGIWQATGAEILDCWKAQQ
ncbi:MAG: polysaccharide deacetylase [Alphaproteobacteria bacterium]|nr:polysaccharide deacetylase [Alphaproteobacteria bacterium]